MADFNNFVNSLRTELSVRDPADPLRQDFDNAVFSLETMFARLEKSEDTLVVLVDALLEDYEARQEQITEHLLNKEFSGARSCVRSLGSGLRPAVTPSKLKAIRELEESAEQHDWHKAFRQWNTLHCRLYPTISVLRRFQNFIRYGKKRDE